MFNKISLLLIVALSSISMVSIDSYKADNRESEKRVYPFRILSTEEDKSLHPRQSQVTLKFNFSEEPQQSQLIYMSINGLLENIEYTSGKTVTYDLTPGKYVFKIWGGPGYEEVITDSIEFKAQTKSVAQVDIFSTVQPVMVFKPVVYFHSDKERDFNLNVLPKGEFTFTYPAIEKGWKGKICKDGSLTVNGKNYPYLFWEAKQNYSFRPSTNGYHLKKEEYIAFLEKKCEELGFTANERTDFITFWGIKMQEHEELFVQFLFNEACNQFATLQFEEQPDAVRRVYMMISPWNSSFEAYLQDHKFDNMPKVAYSVLEWGGYEFVVTKNTFTANR